MRQITEIIQRAWYPEKQRCPRCGRLVDTLTMARYKTSETSHLWKIRACDRCLADDLIIGMMSPVSPQEGDLKFT